MKLADLADNSDLTRIADPRPEDYRRRDKYGTASANLTRALNGTAPAAT